MSTSTSKHLKTAASAGATKSGAKTQLQQQPHTQTAPLSPDAAPVGGVQIPLIKGKDSAKLLPFYTATLQRANEESVAGEELDAIQLELETMLSNVALRYRVLKLEYDSLDKDERRNERRSKHAASAIEKPVSPAASLLASAVAASTTTSPSNPANASTNTKRKRDESSSLVRKPKPSSASSSSTKHTKHSKNAQLAAAHTTDDSMDGAPGGSQTPQGRDHSLPKFALPKNDIPNKFWLSVEPYCMPITNEDLRLLDDLIDQYSGPLVPPIPDLGPHYTRAWAEEDLKDIQQASHPNGLNQRLKQQNSGTLKLLKKAEAIVDNAVTGPLTQRLVSALMEEQLIQHPAGDLAGAGGGGVGGGTESSNSSSENTNLIAHLNFRSLTMMRNGVGIEKRVKKELVELGILDMKDFTHPEEDEIHTEIKRVIAELTAVAEYNSGALKSLRESASEEIKRVEIKRKLDNVDQELCETYKRHMQNKAKRKPMTPEEQHEIFRLTAEQKALSDKLEKTQTKILTHD